MSRKTAVCSFFAILILAAAPPVWAAAQAKPARPSKCFEIRGRAVLYRGDGFFAIWHVGTHHIFYPVGDKSWDLLCSYMDCKSPRKQPALFANMTVCPTEPYKKGSAQPAIVTKVTDYYVVPDWPPSKER